ncbi:MAG: DinB family protein [Bryocella sp.]
MIEPWLRGMFEDVEPVKRAVLHALELAAEDVGRWAAGLSDEEMFARPAGLPSVGFQLRHMVGALDRLLTYAEGNQLSAAQMDTMSHEMDEGLAADALRVCHDGLKRAQERVRAFGPEKFAVVRGVGRKMLPTTVAGLLVHCADHTQRHVGQMVTTVKVVRQ